MAASDRPVVSNTTPLINLVGIGLLGLLEELYGDIWIPDTVYREYVARMRTGDPSLGKLSWVKIVSPIVLDSALPTSLGAGEAGAISLAIAENARAILIDEQLARRVAKEKDLPVVGTLGLLVSAKRSGLLPAVKPVIDKMALQGRHISESLYEQTLNAAGEK